MKDAPLTSIIVLNFNGREHLPDCLGSLLGLDYPRDRLEIVVVDNGSTDGSLDWVRQYHPGVRIADLGANLGFAEGNNRGAAEARGEILVFLNTDTRVTPGWLRALVAPLAGDDRDTAATASKMLDWEGRGLDFPVYATLLGMPYASRDARQFRDPEDYDSPHYLLFPSGGAMAIRRDVFLDAGGFDADYFMYHEDVDLGWRLWLLGHRVLYVPTAVVHHRSGGSAGSDPALLHYLNERNALYTIMKNAGDAWLARLLPLLLFWLIERTGQYLGVSPSAYRPGRTDGVHLGPSTVSPGSLAPIAAAMDLIREFPRLVEKRSAIQARRVRSDEEIAALLDLPREVFEQMMLGAEVDFAAAAGLLWDFGLGSGEASLFGRCLRGFGGSPAGAPTCEQPVAPQLVECLLYLADHSPDEAASRFGAETVETLAGLIGLPDRDLRTFARMISLLGSKLLAGVAGGVPPKDPAQPSGLAAQPPGADSALVTLVRDALWRDTIFYREELSKRTDQLLRALEQRRAHLDDLASSREQTAAARRDLEVARAEAAAREAAWWEERDRLRAATAAAQAGREQAETALRHALESRSDRLGRVLARSLWLFTHPRYVAQRVGQESWQYLRARLPDPVKRWIKRVILRRPQDVWGTPVAASPHTPEAVDAVSRRPPGRLTQPRSAFDLIVFSPIDWQFRFQRPQQLARQFAEHGHRVFYVSVTFDDASPADGAPHGPVLAPLLPHVHELRLPGPASLSVYRDRISEAVLARLETAMCRLRDEQDVVDAVCYVQLPFWRPLTARLRERFGWRVVYDCLDLHSGFATNDPAMLSEEEILLRESDLVVATSRVLCEDLRVANPRRLLVPNAADFDHFCAFVGEAPSWLQSLRRPVIGYYGAIAEWFDSALVGELARLRPQWTFVLIGSTQTSDLQPLEGLPNVHLTGEQPYQRLPAYLHSFDACLIPFRRTPLTEATNPVKLYEYLSAGRPVVAVPLPELIEPASARLIYLAEDAKGFAAGIEQALAEDSPAEIARRRAFAAEHTWAARFEVLSPALHGLFPRASIVIPTHNNLHLTRLCLESIFRNTTWPNLEVIVVDNASTDGTVAYLESLAVQQKGVRCILNDHNAGFSKANNQGIAAATGDYLVLLNNDTIVTRGWLTAMIRYLETHLDVGMVCPATNLAGNEAKINVDYTNVADMEEFAGLYTREHAGEAFDIPMLGFFCVVIPRRVIHRVGMLDERFGIGMFEDDDYSHRVRQAGYRLVCTDGAFVHHFHSATMRRFGEQDYLGMFEANRAKFEQKWGIRWTPHRYRWQR